MNIEDIKKIAEGRVWTGEMAKDLKLVDELGGLDEAVEVAASHAKIERYTLVSYPEKEDFLTSLLNTRPSRYISSRMQENFGEYYNGLRFVKISRMPIACRRACRLMWLSNKASAA